MVKLKEALADGQIYNAEYLKLNKEGIDVVNAMMAALDRLNGMIVKSPNLEVVNDLGSKT